MSDIRHILNTINPLNHLFGRIFLGFWATVVILIAMTIFITFRFNQFSKVQSASPQNVNLIKKIKNQIQRSNSSDLVSLIKTSQRNTRALKVILKDNITGEIIYDRRTALTIDLEQFYRLSLEPKPLEIRLDNAILLGPITLSKRKQTYQLMLILKTPSRSNIIYATLNKIPLWVKVFACVALSLIMCWLIARSISKPIYNLRQSAQILANGELSHRLKKGADRNDELGYLSKDFNYMAEKLESLVELHKRLLADVSHELRTPLTRLELSLAIALKKPENCEPQLQRIESEIHKLDDMIGNILKLARLESEETQLELHEFNLTALIDEIIQSASIEAHNKSIEIHSKLSKDIIFTGDTQLLNSAIENILRNAIKYTPEGGCVYINLTAENATTDNKATNSIKINILDSGFGLKEADLDRIFMPFYRAEKSRDRNSGGTGLGLAIAHKAIQKHNGTLTATNQQGAGLKVEITLPY